jgi:DNA topoisomerase-1
VLTNFGRFGPYVKYGDKFVSIKGKDPLEITLEEALEAIAAKKAADAKREILAFEGGIRVLHGRYGPYITDGSRNARVPKDADPEKLTLEQCRELLEKAPAKKTRRAPAKKRTAGKAAAKKPAKGTKKRPTKKKRSSG